VVNWHDSPARFPLNRGNRAFGPFRFPDLESFQFCSPAARFARPAAYASLEFSAHQGATPVFAWFQVLRSDHADQDRAGVRSSVGRP
jgi:hypothetical protein